MKTIITFLSNWLLLLSSPIWVLPALFIYGFRGSKEERREFLKILSGKVWLFS